MSLRRETLIGDIGVAWTEDDPREGKWIYQQVALHEPFHLSYPFGIMLSLSSTAFLLRSSLTDRPFVRAVFFHDGYYWMIPEAHQSNQIRCRSYTHVPLRISSPH